MYETIVDKVPNLFVSVIIPVFNDAESLTICLNALKRQTYPKNLYQAIVVDNGSDLDGNVESVVDRFDWASLAVENRPGSYAARNRGIVLAQSEIIAFTDADCIPAEDWIEKGVAKLLRVPNCGLVAGKVDFFFQDPDRPTAVELYESLMAIPQNYFIEIFKFGATANLFTFKSVFAKVGYFDERLKSSGDREWGTRVFLSGYQLIYAEDACVAHPARSSYSQLYKKIARLTGGYYDWTRNLKTNYSIQEFLLDLAEDLKPPLTTIFLIISGKNLWYWSDFKLQGILSRLELIAVILFVKFVSAWEKIRLYFGGSSRRA